MSSLTGNCFGIRSEKFFQCLRLSPGDYTDRIGSVKVLFTSPEVLPKMCQVIERVRIEPLFHCIGPLLVRDGDISNRAPDGSSQSFGDLFHCWSFADQGVHVL